jgi:hypothetical protein
MGAKNSSVTRVWPVLLELFCKKRESGQSLHLLLDLAFKNSGNMLAAQMRDSAGAVLQELIEKPAVPRTEYGLKVRLPLCFEYSLPPTERFLLWLIETTGAGCLPRKGLDVSRRSAGRRTELFGEDEAGRSDARNEATQNLLSTGVNGSRHGWWAFEGPTSVDCFLETPEAVLLVEGKRTDTVATYTDWCSSRHQIARNLEAAQSVANGRRYAVMVAAEKHIEISAAEIALGLPHMTPSERAFLAGHYIGCVLWEEICREANLSVHPERELHDVRSAEQWLRERDYIVEI